jgi:hypothetical protein
MSPAGGYVTAYDRAPLGNPAPSQKTIGSAAGRRLLFFRALQTFGALELWNFFNTGPASAVALLYPFVHFTCCCLLLQYLI